MAQALVLTLLETGRSSKAAIAAEASVLIKTEVMRLLEIPLRLFLPLNIPN